MQIQVTAFRTFKASRWCKRTLWDRAAVARGKLEHQLKIGRSRNGPTLANPSRGWKPSSSNLVSSVTGTAGEREPSGRILLRGSFCASVVGSEFP
jgi:hypothetical protein